MQKRIFTILLCLMLTLGLGLNATKAQVNPDTIVAPDVGRPGGTPSSNTTTTPTSGSSIQNAINALEETAGTAGLPKQTLGTTLKNVIDNVIGLLGGAFLILCVYGGLKMMFSKGDPKMYEDGRKTISWGVIGMVVVLISYGIVDLLFGTIVPGLTK